MTRLLLIRHGQIAANVTRHWHGSLDTHLTDEGRRQAERLAHYFRNQNLDIDAIYSSPLIRTQDTARAIAQALGIDLQLEPDIREYGIGELEGTHFTTLAEEHRFFERQQNDPHFAPREGESIIQVATRMTAAVARISDRHPQRQVILVSHGAAIAVMLAQLFHRDPLRWTEYPIHNASVSELVLEPTPRLIRVNEIGHLH